MAIFTNNTHRLSVFLPEKQKKEMSEFPKKYKQNPILRSSLPKTSKGCICPSPFSLERAPDKVFFLSLIHADWYQKYAKMKGDAYCVVPSWVRGSDATLAKKNLTQTKILAQHLWIAREKEVSTKDGEFLKWMRFIWTRRYHEGIIQKEDAVLDRSIKTQTVVAIDEIIEEIQQKYEYTIRCFVSTKNHSLDIVLNEPEILFGGVAFALHPLHKKAKLLRGASVIIPMINRAVPIVFDERVDLYKRQGVMCVIPGHDELSFAIAKDHNLPIDVFSFDQYGKFTDRAGDFSGKPIDEFTENIIQNLTDINNLISKQECMVPVYKIKKTGEVVRKHAHTEFFRIQGTEKWCISSNAKSGLRLPLWVNKEGREWCLDEQWLVDVYNNQENKENKELWLSSMIFSCIADGNLPNPFHMDDLIDVCMKHAQGYMQAKEAEKILLLSKKDDMISHELFAEELLGSLDKAFAIHTRENDMYSFDMQSLCWSSSPLVHVNKICDNMLQNALLMAYSMGKHEEHVFVGSEATKMFFQKYTVWKRALWINALKAIEYVLPVFPLSAEEIKEKIKESLGEEVRVWMFLSGAHINLKKWRNTARFIVLAAEEEGNIPEYLSHLQEQISMQVEDLGVIDVWCLGKLQELLDEYAQIQDNHTFQEKQKELIYMREEDVSRKYLEMIKLHPSSLSKKVALVIIALLTKAVYPLIPVFAQELWIRMGRKEAIDEEMPSVNIRWKEKNYTINLFMDIIDKLLLLKQSHGLKNHEKTQIMIRSNPDFFRYVKANEESMRKILNVEVLVHGAGKEEDLSGYRTEDIIDIQIGIKKYEEVADGGHPIKSCMSLSQQLEKKKEYLQHLRLLLPQMMQAGYSQEQILERKQEIEQVKQEIEDIEYEISKEKMKKNSPCA